MVKNRGRIQPYFETTTTNRPRHSTTGRHRQRSFDDTESIHYARERNMRYENIYEKIREEPIYPNASMASNRNDRPPYGRLDVLGHGIGRINYHLSSSCGNIDHFNIGNHYAIMGHSHLGAVGHIRLNATNTATKAKETADKSLNFFSCLGRENSQSMSNICPDATNSVTVAEQPVETHPTEPPVLQHGGAIPKVKTNKVDSAQSTSASSTSNNNTIPIHSTALNRMSKSSLQWLLVNKWLPLWVGNGSDCNVMDFNFMFSHKCNECNGNEYDQLPYSTYGDAYDDFHLNGYRNLTHQYWHGNDIGQFDASQYRRLLHSQRMNQRYARHGNDSGYAHGMGHFSHDNENPFRRWELNSENNSFRPASSVRRITDGTYPQHFNNNPSMRVINNRNCSNRSNGMDEPSCSYRTKEQADDQHGGRGSCRTMDQNEGAANSTDTKKQIFSPDLSARRYSENAEDDQYKNSHSTDNDDDSLNDSDIESSANLDSMNP